MHSAVTSTLERLCFSLRITHPVCCDLNVSLTVPRLCIPYDVTLSAIQKTMYTSGAKAVVSWRDEVRSTQLNVRRFYAYTRAEGCAAKFRHS